MFVILFGSTKALNISSITECEKLKILAHWRTSHIKLNQVIIKRLMLFEQHWSQAEASFCQHIISQRRHHYPLHDKGERRRSKEWMSVWVTGFVQVEFSDMWVQYSSALVTRSSPFGQKHLMINTRCKLFYSKNLSPEIHTHSVIAKKPFFASNTLPLLWAGFFPLKRAEEEKWSLLGWRSPGGGW